MAAPLQSLSRDPECYMKAWQHAMSLSTEFHFLTVWRRGAFDEAVVANLPFRLDEREQLKVLGIGSGTGMSTHAHLVSDSK